MFVADKSGKPRPVQRCSLIAGSREAVAVAYLPRAIAFMGGAKAGRLDQNIRMDFGLVGKTDSRFHQSVDIDAANPISP